MTQVACNKIGDAQILFMLLVLVVVLFLMLA